MAATGSPALWHPPAGTAPRGTVVVLPGRGEDPALYERFGTRIGADGYRVHVLAAATLDDTVDALAGLVGRAQAPLVLVGTDTGALRALVAATRLPDVAGIVLAGTPGRDGAAPTAWDDELDARSACPAHRERLGTELVRGALAAEPVPAPLLQKARAARPHVPALVLHGTADTVADVDAARLLAYGLPDVRLVTVRDGRHDVLNDVTHRSVAAQIVQFLEQVRAGASVLQVEEVRYSRDEGAA